MEARGLTTTVHAHFGRVFDSMGKEKPGSVHMYKMAEVNAALKDPGKYQIYPEKPSEISDFWRDKYEKYARKYWDIFYKRNENRFFKDRHYLDKEWGQYFKDMGTDAGSGPASVNHSCMVDKRVILEVGCGTGNTVFPLVAMYPGLFVYACDFSPRAVSLLKAHEEFSEDRVKAFVCDATSDSLSEIITQPIVDVVTLIFMLSSVGPEKMLIVLRNIKSVMKPGGHVLFRDYAVGDLAQERFMSKDQKISDNFYVRGDGTRAYYFSEDGLKKLFLDEGFECKEMVVHNRQLENRARKIKMDRRWIQGVFQLSGGRVLEAEHLYEKSSEKYAVTTSTSDLTTDQNGSPEPSANVESPDSKYGDTPFHLHNSQDLLEEIDLSEGLGAELFGSAPSTEPLSLSIAGYRVQANCLPSENQHTFSSTGFMLWDSAKALAFLLALNQSFTKERRVLELGCGSVGLCSLIASIGAEQVTATDGDGGTLELLRENLQLNKESFEVDKIRLRRLEWGNQEDIAIMKSSNGNKGFDLIIGTDVTYVREAVPLLFETARCLLEHSSSVSQPQLILCHRIRQVSEAEILASAEEHGFCVKGIWTSHNATGERSGREHSLVIEHLFEGLEEIANEYNSLQLLLLTPL